MNTPAPIEDVDYTGHFRNALDGSRRVMLPAVWRGEELTRFTMLPWPIGVEEFILVLPPARWRTMLAKLKESSLTNNRVAALEQEIAANAAHVTLDKVGRLCVPEGMAKKLKVKGEVDLVGRLDKFEIWEPKACEASRAKNKKIAAEAAQEINL